MYTDLLLYVCTFRGVKRWLTYTLCNLMLRGSPVRVRVVELWASRGTVLS